MPSSNLALVTGASSGIGRELAVQLAGRGNDLIITGRAEEALQALRDDLPQRRVHVVVADLSRREGTGKLLEYIDRHSLAVEILVNNAGFGRIGGFIELTEQEQIEMIEVNISSILRLTHAIANGMIARGHGRILNVASTAAFSPGPLMAVYYATKAFDYSFSMAIGEELRVKGIEVTTLCPGATRTGFDRASGLAKERAGSRASMRADRVATAALDGLEAGRRLVVPGISNRIAVAASRFAPRGMLLKAIHRFNAGK